MSWAMAPLALLAWTLEMDEIRSGAPFPSARKVTCRVRVRMRMRTGEDEVGVGSNADVDGG